MCSRQCCFGYGHLCHKPPSRISSHCTELRCVTVQIHSFNSQHIVRCKIVILRHAQDLRSPFQAVAPCGYALDARAVLLLFALPACLHMDLPYFLHQISSPFCEPVQPSSHHLMEPPVVSVITIPTCIIKTPHFKTLLLLFHCRLDYFGIK